MSEDFAHSNPLRDNSKKKQTHSKSHSKMESSGSSRPIPDRRLDTSSAPPLRARPSPDRMRSHHAADHSKSSHISSSSGTRVDSESTQVDDIEAQHEEKEYSIESIYQDHQESGIELETLGSKGGKRPAKPPRSKPSSGEAAPLMKLNPAAAESGGGREAKGGAKEGSGTDIGGGAGAGAKPPDRFKGLNGVQYGLWAHWLAYGAAAMCLCMGIFAILWDSAPDFDCKIHGDEISEKYLYDKNGDCPTIYKTDGEKKEVCCDPDDSDSTLSGNTPIGVFYILYSIFIILYENPIWGFGMWFPNDTPLYAYRISFIGILHGIIGVVGLADYATALAGACLLTTGAVYSYAAFRLEAGDGGRASRIKARKTAAAQRAEQREGKSAGLLMKENALWLLSFNPVSFLMRIYNEDKLSSYAWVGLFLILNFVLFAYTLNAWYAAVDTMEDEMIDGKIDVHCSSLNCRVNRTAVRYGPLSRYAPWAKAFGGLLNLNCALLLLPVIRMLLRKLNNYGESFATVQHSNDLLGRLCARPLTRYIPLQKNIEFHKLCAGAVFISAWGHMVFHWLNLYHSNNVTMRRFRTWGWDGTDYFTGALITYAMYVIYTGAPAMVRMAKYEIFFKSHHLFIVFYLALFLHGPVIFYWTAVPVLLYLTERYMQSRRGDRPYLLVKVEWISPVMAIYFRPVIKDDFRFKEGQYLYVNCPHISASEWHPFTISSAADDLEFGPRIHLETGEEVVEVPRPKSLPPKAKWNKYCLVSKNWRELQEWEYIDKSDTGYNDFVSIHVKVHGLEEPIARTWTRKLKEYFESMSPSRKFPFYFTQRDGRGDLTIGKQFGPDGKQILRIDGPHSAPSEHYTNYGTVMLIGAGIGLTPCASILCALTKYRWRKNFNPELVHFYWIVRQNEVDSFQWLIHMLTELSFELKRSKASNQIERRYYCEIHIYVTAVSKKPLEVKPLHRPKKTFIDATRSVFPTFTADELYEKVLNPTVTSKGQVEKMRAQHRESSGNQIGENRLQDIWVWNGRPNWDEIFRDMKEQRQHKDIGVCFCGAPVIGADLKTMCERYSSAKEQCLFSLHKENF